MRFLALIFVTAPLPLVPSVGLADTITVPVLSAPVTEEPALGASSATGTRIEADVSTSLTVSGDIVTAPVISRMVEIGPGIFEVVKPSSDLTATSKGLPLEGSVTPSALEAHVAIAPSVSGALSRNATLVIYDIRFGFDQANILDTAVPSIQSIGERMSVDPELCIVVEGHTDAMGNDDYNKRLSQQRAEAVKQAIMTKFGIQGDRITAIGRGESDPIAPNDTDEGRALNRRVEVKSR